MNWHLRRGNRDCGQYSDEQIRSLARQGQILPSDLLWKPGMRQWVAAGTVRGLLLAGPIRRPSSTVSPTGTVAPQAVPSRPEFAFTSSVDLKRSSLNRKRKTPLTNKTIVVIGVVAAVAACLVAAVLFSHEGPHDPTKLLSDAEAKRLLRVAKRANKDSLNAPKSKGITPEAAATLARFNGSLHLDDLSTISPEAATALAKHEGPLSLNGLDALTPSMARELASCKGPLFLDGLQSLSPEVATYLSPIRHDVHLAGIKAVSGELAKALSAFDTDLWLGGVKDLSAEAAKHIVDGEGVGKLWFTGLERIAADARRVVADNQSRLFAGGHNEGDPVIYGRETQRAAVAGNNNTETAKSPADDKPGDREPPLVTGKQLKLQGEKFEGKRVRVVGRVWYEGPCGAFAPPELWVLGTSKFVELRITSTDISNEVFCYAGKIDAWMELLMNADKSDTIIACGTLRKCVFAGGHPTSTWGVFVDYLAKAE